MKRSKYILLSAVLIIACNNSFGQCADSTNIYAFEHNGHSYEVVKENSTWTDASVCAVDRNGYLAEINDEAEQDAIFIELTNNAGIVTANTQNQFGTASVWLGGSDSVTEGNWIWDGDNDGAGPQFWMGASGGSPVGGLYTNWGTSPAEPDNSGGQDHLTIIIKTTAVNFGLWNDLISTNSIYYLIEHDNILSNLDIELKSNLRIYPNPFTNSVSIENSNTKAMNRVEIIDLLGQKIKTIERYEMTSNEINVSSINPGMYILNVHFENGRMISQKIVK